MLTLIILVLVIIGLVIGLSIMMNKLARKSSGVYDTINYSGENTEEVDTLLYQNISNNTRSNIRNRGPDSSGETLATRASTTEIDRIFIN